MKTILLALACFCVTGTANAECSFFAENLVGSDIYVDVVDENGDSISSNPDLDFFEADFEDPKQIELHSSECEGELIFIVFDCSAGKTFQTTLDSERRRFSNLPVYLIDLQSKISIGSSKLGQLCR